MSEGSGSPSIGLAIDRGREGRRLLRSRHRLGETRERGGHGDGPFPHHDSNWTGRFVRKHVCRPHHTAASHLSGIDLNRTVVVGEPGQAALRRPDQPTKVVILGRRLRAAAAALHTTDEPVARVALDQGFGDLSTFNHAFRRVMGVTPTAYRLST